MTFTFTRALFLIMTTFWLAPALAYKPAPKTAQLVSFDKTNTTITYIKTSNPPGSEDLIKINTSNGKVIKRIPFNNDGKLKPFASTPDGFKFLAESAKGIAVIHNGTGKTLRTLPYPNNPTDWGISPVVSSNTVYVAIPSNDKHKIYLVHTGTGRIIRTIDINQASKDTFITAIGFSNNNRVIAYKTETRLKNTLHLYDINNSTEIKTLELPNSGQHDLAYLGSDFIKFNKKGNQLISYSRALPRKGIQLIDITKNEVKTLKPVDFIFAGFSKNTRNVIAVSYSQKLIHSYDIQSGTVKKTSLQIPSNSGVPSFVAQSNDNALLTIPLISQANKNDSFLIIDSNTGKIIRTINSSPN